MGLVLTSINLLSTRWLQHRWEAVVDQHNETDRITDGLAEAASSITEEGFGYILSGEMARKDECLRKLQKFETVRRQLLARSDIRDAEYRILVELGQSQQSVQRNAERMFDAYELSRRDGRSRHWRGVPQPLLDAYETTVYVMSAGVSRLSEHIRQRSTTDNEAARKRSDRVLAAIGLAASVLGVGMGTAFGIRLTRPLFRLRDAAIRVGEGNFNFAFALAGGSQDEIGELARAFADMAANIRRLMAEEAEQKNRLANIFASLGETLLVCNPSGKIKAVNRAACATLGYREDELIGQPLATFLVSTRFEDLFAQTVRQAAEGTSANVGGDPQLLRKDGKQIAVSLSTSLLRTPAAGTTGLICVARDLSEHRRLEGELRQAQKLEAIGRMASGIAHEINTPTQFVSDSVYFIRDAAKDLFSLIEKYQIEARSSSSGLLPETLAQLQAAEQDADLPYLIERLPLALERALDGLSRIATIVRSMKIFAHPDERQMAPVDLNQAVQSTLTVASNEYKYVAELETDFGELPHVTCHAGEVNQAVLNLIVNAAHAIADHTRDGERGLIRVQTRLDGEWAVISISDSGGGIPDKIREHIFDPFFTTKALGRGTGQGLSVARSVIVEKHGGQLSFETELDRGTTFEIRLPLVRVSQTLVA